MLEPSTIFKRRMNLSIAGHQHGAVVAWGGRADTGHEKVIADSRMSIKFAVLAQESKKSFEEEKRLLHIFEQISD